MVIMKPETIARRGLQRIIERDVSRQILIRRLREKVIEYGHDSIWAEMLNDAENGNQVTCNP